MFFANPMLLWALCLGLIPIIIYYLLRFRSLSVTWGANYVLERALERLKNRLNLDQIILMTLRVLACLLIVLAFARPMMRSSNAVAAGTGIHHVIVLDGSYSMLAGTQNHRRFDASIDAMKKLTATWGRGETWSLLLLTDQPRWVVDGQTINSSEETAAKLDTLKPSENSASLASALAQVAQTFPRGKAEIFIFADDQASTWDQTERAKLPAELDAPVYWLNPSGDPRPNLAVTSLRPAADRVLTDNPCRITVSLRNFSTAKVEDVNVELLIDGSFDARQSVSLLPNQETPIHFDVKFAGAGSHHLCAQIPEDALDFDNRLFAGVEAVEQMTVVELRDAGRNGKFDSSWGAIETLERSRQIAAKASGDASGGRGQILWKLNEGTVDTTSLAGVDAVLLDGGKKLTPELAATLRDFVQAGGGLVLVADPNVDAPAWNRLLDDAGLLPAKLARLHTNSLGGDRFRTLARGEVANSPLNVFEGDTAGDISHARIYSYFELAAAKPDAVNVVRLDDQSPWAIRTRSADGGSVMLLTTGLAGQGNNLLVREFFVPLLYQIMQDAAVSRTLPRTVARGESLRLRIADAKQISGVTFSKQGQDATAVPLRTNAGVTTADIADTTLESGLYSMLTLTNAGGENAGKRAWFGLQGPRTDSDLTPISTTQLAAVTKQLNLTVASDWPQLEQAMQKQRTGHEWQSWMAIAGALILLCEMLFQRRFSPEPPRRRHPAARSSRSEPQRA